MENVLVNMNWKDRVFLMTTNMERMRFEVARTILTYFPRDYIQMVFVGGVSEKEFIDEIMVEFIKYAFDNSQERHPLRYYVPYGVDENNDERMLYTRLRKYCQKYRDQEYEEFKRKGMYFEELRAKKMQTMDEKKEGYSITPMQYFEMTTLRDIAALKAFVENRLSNVKKVSNKLFEDMMREYDKNIEEWEKKSNESDYNKVFYSLAFFTIDWKYGFELAYLMAKKMEQLGVKEVDKNFFSILWARMIIQSFLGCNVSIDSRMIRPRQKMIDVLVPADLKWSDEIEVDRMCYAELLVIMAKLNNGIKLADSNTLREQFAKETTIEDWASFFKEYDIFAAWNKKELSSVRIRNMRKIISQMYK